jgi:pyrroloquinoline quinone biosynthesis protein D
MTDAADLASVPVLPRGVRLHHDGVRGVEVLLGPERTLMLDDTGYAILCALDGTRTVAAVGAHLAARYDAPQDAVTSDVATFLRGLADKRLVDLNHG